METLIAAAIEKWIHSVAPKRGWVIFPVIFFAAIYSFFFSAAYPEWHRFARIASSGTRTEGTITAKEPKNHASIRYSYSVAMRNYSGSEATGFDGIPPLEKLEIGKHIPVAYCATEPSLSLPGDPQDLTRRGVG